MSSRDSKDKQDLLDGKWIYRLARAKAGKEKDTNWYPSLVGVAKQYGFLSAFDEIVTVKVRCLARAHEVFARAKENRALPKQTSKDKQERSDGVWIMDRRRAKRGRKTSSLWYPDLSKIAKQYGFPEAFDLSVKLH